MGSKKQKIIQFEGTIKEIKSRIDVDNNKHGRLVIEFLPSNKTLNELNKIHKPEKTVFVFLTENNVEPDITSGFDIKL